MHKSSERSSLIPGQKPRALACVVAQPQPSTPSPSTSALSGSVGKEAAAAQKTRPMWVCPPSPEAEPCSAEQHPPFPSGVLRLASEAVPLTPAPGVVSLRLLFPRADYMVSALCESDSFHSKKSQARSGGCAAVAHPPSSLPVCLTFMKKPQLMYPVDCWLMMDRSQFSIVRENAVTVLGTSVVHISVARVPRSSAVGRALILP